MYGIEILSFLSSPSFVTFSALFHALPLTTNLLTFPIRRIWNLGDRYQFLTMIEKIAHRLTYAHSIQQRKKLNDVKRCPRDRCILPYWNIWKLFIIWLRMFGRICLVLSCCNTVWPGMCSKHTLFYLGASGNYRKKSFYKTQGLWLLVFLQLKERH